MNDLNILKLILNTDEDEVYRYYPSRKDNIYAKSVKKIIPYKEFDFFNIPIESVKNMIRLPNDKYYGINFTNITNPKETQRVEYRYIGGRDYEKNIGNVVYFLDRFILDTYGSVDSPFNISDSRKLEDYLDRNISKLKSFSKYENFLIEYPKITLQIDQNNTYELVNSYFIRFYKKIWDILDSCEDIGECIINYTTKQQTLEIVDADIKLIGGIKNVDLISCNITGGMIEGCQIYSSEIVNAHISKSKIDNSSVKGSKVITTRVETSKLENCYFEGGVLNSDMVGGVWRSGELGPFASISPETKIVDDYTNFFDTKFDTQEEKDTKGVIKIYKK